MPRLRRVEVHAARFMFNEDTGFGDPCVEKFGGARRARRARPTIVPLVGRARRARRNWYGHLILDVPLNVGNAEYITQQHVPKLLVFALLAAALERPVFDEFLCGLPLFHIGFHVEDSVFQRFENAVAALRISFRDFMPTLYHISIAAVLHQRTKFIILFR